MINRTLSSKERRRKRRLVDPDKRKRIAVACETCKKRKKKCNGSQPCKLCNSKGYACVYVQRVGPNDDVDDEDVATSNATIDRRSSTATTATSDQIYPAAQHQYYENNIATTNTTTSSSPNTSAPASISAPSPGAGGKTVGSSGFQYIGQSCTISLIEQIRHLLRTSNSGLTLSNDFLSNSYIDTPYPKTATYPIQLPSREQADRLVNLFVENIQSITYVFDMDSFYSSLNEVYRDPLSTPSSSLCLLHLVFALGSVYDDECNFSSDMFFDSGRKLLDEAPIDYGEVWVVEAFLLVYLYHEIKCRRNGAWVELGKAIRHAQALGMDRSLANNDPHRVSLWKSLYIHDTLTSTYLGRSRIVPRLHLDQVVSPLDHFVSLCNIVGDIHQHIYQSTRFSSNTIYGLITALKDWLSLFQARTVDVNDKLNVLLNLTYLHTIILLTRPFLFHASVNGNSHKTFNDLALSCIQSAFSTCKIIVDFNSTLPSLWKSPTIVYYLFTAGAVLLLYRFRRRNAITPPSEYSSLIYSALDNAITHLSGYSDIDTSAKQFYLTLTELDDIIKSSSPQAANTDASSPPRSPASENSLMTLATLSEQRRSSVVGGSANQPPTPPPISPTFTEDDEIIKKRRTSSLTSVPHIYDNIPVLGLDNLSLDTTNHWTFTSRGPLMTTFDTPIEGVIMTPCY